MNKKSMLCGLFFVLFLLCKSQDKSRFPFLKEAEVTIDTCLVRESSIILHYAADEFGESRTLVEALFRGGIVPIIESKDKNVIAFLSAISYDQIRKTGTPHEKEQRTGLEDSFFHRECIADNLKYSLGKKNGDININKYIYYYADNEAKNLFNADSLITFPIHFDTEVICREKSIPVIFAQKGIKFEPRTIYRDKYTSCRAFVLIKNEIGFIMMYLLYTDEGRKNEEYYLDILSKSIQFK